MDAQYGRCKEKGVLGMTELRDVIAYFIKKYPFKSELSNARVTKMVYLADWRHLLSFGTQITGIKWYFDNYGPFVWDIKSTAEKNPDLFAIENTSTPYGTPKIIFDIKNLAYIPALDSNVKDSLDHVIQETKNLSYSQFIRLVYSTYPIITSDRYTYIDLPKKAKEYLQLS